MEWSRIPLGFEPTATADQLVVFCKLFLIMFVMVNVTRDAWRLRTFMIFFRAVRGVSDSWDARELLHCRLHDVWPRALEFHLQQFQRPRGSSCFFRDFPMSLALALTEPKGWISDSRSWVLAFSHS